MTTATQKLCNVIRTEQLDRYLFRSHPAPSNVQHLYGGLVLAQALDAAMGTVGEERLVHSMHAYFLRAGHIKQPVIFEVDPIRDGGSFTTRRVVAKQDGQAILSCTLSFKVAEEGLQHQLDTLRAPPPGDVLPDSEQVEALKRSDPAFVHLPDADTFGAFEMRTVGDLPAQTQKGASPEQGYWFKTGHSPGDEPSIHLSILAYISDTRLMGTALRPHGITFFDPNLQGASLNHALWIHQPFRVDEWLYFDMNAPTASSGMGMNFGRFFNEQGVLVASTAQESLMRLKS